MSGFGAWGSALHPRLHTEDLAPAWRDGHMLRLPQVLQPGLAAELALELRSLPLMPRVFAPQNDLSWSCDLGLPSEPDPQHPECLLRLPQLMRVDLPLLLYRVTGRALVLAEPWHVHLWSWRKGSFVEEGAALARPGGVDLLLHLSWGQWPEAWGGHMRWQGRGEALSLPPAFDTLDILDGGRFEVPLLLRSVETLMIRARLEPA